MALQQGVAPANGINVNKIGYFLDGWADIVEGVGSKAPQVRQHVLNLLQGRGMPDITLGSKTGYVSLISQERRDYLVSETYPGARTTIYIAQHGNDLYTSWRTWIEPKINWLLLRWFLGGSVLLGLFSGGIQQSGGYFSEPQTTFSFSGWLIGTIGYLTLFAIGLAIFGRIVKGNILALFLIEPNIFDAEDITAMSLSVHKSILRALDSIGIDNSKLRLKQGFSGGRRNVMV